MRMLLLIPILLLLSCKQEIVLKDQRLKDYIPSTEGMKFKYSYSFKRMRDGEIVKGTTETVLIKVKIDPNPDIYCFVAPDETTSKNPTLENQTHLEGIHCFSGDTVKISPRFTLLEPDTASIHNNFSVLFSPLVNKGDSSFIMAAPDIIYTYKITGFEKIKTPAGEFTCMKLEYKRYDLLPKGAKGEVIINVKGADYPAKLRTAYAWIAKEIGMVKWRRYTGRIDVLESYSK